MADEELPEVELATPLNFSLLFGALAVAGAALVPNMIQARKHGNERYAIGSLKSIRIAQSLFRESDKESDGNLDYGTLKELATAGNTGLIGRVLGCGTKCGYLFEATYSRSKSEFLWFATARPAIPGTTGRRYFVTNHEGAIFYTLSQPFRLNAMDCTLPAGAHQIGK